jgi:hypothetical protein
MFVLAQAQGVDTRQSGGAVSLQRAAWVAGPELFETDLPPVGRSLFDHLLANDVLPFPFSRLIERIEAEVRRDPSALPPVKQVLIPLGRSLQRNAGAPDFFRYPRVVAAVDAEAADSSGMLLKDRLFLGYHEKAAIIEVISYNEAAGRFEFQVVKDYRPGATPRVFYASRAICTSCHQNGAPIFSRPLWDETNANSEISMRLKENSERFYGVPVERGVDLPNAIDSATDRANRFSLYQRLWREGCGANDEPAIRCRAGLFALALKSRLSGGRFFDTGSREYREDVVPALLQNGRQLWPGGLLIPDSDVLNRDPLRFQRSHRESVVPAEVDPLVLRAPLGVWSIENPEAVPHLIAGLSEFLADPDLRRLDRHLSTDPGNAGKRSYRAECELTRKAISASAYRLNFRCQAETGVGAALSGVVHAEGGRARGNLDRLTLDGAEEIRDLVIDAKVQRDAEKLSFRPRQKYNGMSARRADGQAIESVALAWQAGALGATFTGEAEVTISDDYAPVRAAIEAMAARRIDAFSEKPFRRAALMPALGAKLNMAASKGCCLEDKHMNPAALDSGDSGSRPEKAAPELRGFYRFCVPCHRTRERFPPNFLYGDSAQIKASLERCAPRIYYRLHMGTLALAERAKTPMPPASALYAMDISPERWRESAVLAEIKHYVSALLPPEAGTEAVIRVPYESLPECPPTPAG